MKIENVPFTPIDWSAVTPTAHPGETGTATWRTVEIGNVRVRLVEYSPGYKSDHWCGRGHVVHVLKGTLETELRDGRRFTTHAPGTWVVADGEGGTGNTAR